MLIRLTLILLVLTSCGSPTENRREEKNMEQTFNEFLDQYYEERLKLFPLEATMIGDNRFNHLLPNDISEEFRSQLKGFYQDYNNRLGSYDRNSLTEQEQVSYDIFKREMEVGLHTLTFNEHYIPVQQFWGLTLMMPQI